MLTTTLRDVAERPARRTRFRSSTALASPISRRRCGTAGWGSRRPSRSPAPSFATGRCARRRLPRPAHDGAAAWCRARGVPYVFEPRWHVPPTAAQGAAQALLDTTLGRGVAAGARARRSSPRRASGTTSSPAVSSVARPRPRERVSGAAAGGTRRPARRASFRPTRRSSSTSAGSPPRRGSSSCSRRPPAARRARRARRPGRPSRHDDSGAGGARRAAHSRGASTCCRRRPGRRSTSTAGPTCSCSPRAARTSGSWPPRLRRWGRRSSSPTGAASPSRSARARHSSCRTTGSDGAPITRVLTDAALAGRLAEGALAAARRSAWDAVVEAQLALYAEAIGALTPGDAPGDARRGSRCSARSPSRASARARPGPARVAAGSAASARIAAAAATWSPAGTRRRSGRPRGGRAQHPPGRRARAAGRRQPPR